MGVRRKAHRSRRLRCHEGSVGCAPKHGGVWHTVAGHVAQYRHGIRARRSFKELHRCDITIDFVQAHPSRVSIERIWRALGNKELLNDVGRGVSHIEGEACGRIKARVRVEDGDRGAQDAA